MCELGLVHTAPPELHPALLSVSAHHKYPQHINVISPYWSPRIGSFYWSAARRLYHSAAAEMNSLLNIQSCWHGAVTPFMPTPWVLLERIYHTDSLSLCRCTGTSRFYFLLGFPTNHRGFPVGFLSPHIPGCCMLQSWGFQGRIRKNRKCIDVSARRRALCGKQALQIFEAASV